MADLQKKIEILFQGTNRVGGVITSVGRDLDNLNYRITSVAQPFAEVTAAVAKLDALLAALAAGGIALAYNESSKLQSSFTELKKVAGDNAEVLNTAKAGAKDLSNTYGESAADILAATANYVQAGFSVEEAMSLAKTGMDLVIAGGVEASLSSEILIASLKGFRAPASEAGRLLDILNEISNRYATDIEQLGTGMAGISPIARTMGFSMEETAGILTPVIEIFRSGDEAAVALKTGLLKLIDDTEPVQEALASIGVSQKDANGELRSGKDILRDVSVAFQTLDQDQKLFVTQQLVGIHQSARMVEVFDNLAKSSEITATAMNSTGSAAKEVAERLADPEVAVNRLVQGFKNLASSVGDDFQTASTGAVDGITAVLNSLEGAVDEGAFEPLLGALNDFLDGISEKFQMIAKNLPEALDDVDYSGFLDELGDLRETVGSLFDDIDIGDPESLAQAIQKVVDTFESLVEFSEGVASVFVTVAGYASDLIDGLNSLDDGTLSLLGNLSGLATTVTMVAAPVGLVTKAVGGFGSVLTTSTKLAGSMATGLGSLITSFPALFSVVSAGVGGWAFGSLLREAIPEIDETAQSLLGLIDKYTGLFGVYEEQQRVQAESIAVEQRFREVMEARAQVAEAAAEVSYESNLAIVESMDNARDGTAELTEELRKLGVLVEEPKKIEIDTNEAKQKFEELSFYLSEGTDDLQAGWHTIKVAVDTNKVAEAKKEIEESIPAVKRLEIETDLRIAEVKAKAETIQNALKYKAQVDIAEIESAAKVTTALSENITEMFANTGKQITDLYSQWDKGTSLAEKWSIQESLRAETETRERTLKMQEKLNDAQIKFLNARTKRMKSGEALITVDGAGMQPHLEMIMWELFGAIQIRAKEEGLDQLLLGGL